MTPKTLVDTDVLSAIMRRQHDVMHRATDYLQHHPRFSFSVITAYEILRGLKAKGASKKVNDFNAFCQNSELLPLTMATVEVAATIHADLLRRGETLDHADILIAATAISAGCCLATNNVRHFVRISGLTVDNWLSPSSSSP